MKNKGKEKKQQTGSSRARFLAFALVAGGVTGYLLFRAGQEPPPQADPSPVARSAPAAQSKPLSKGDRLPKVSLLSLNGEPLELRVSGGSRPVLLYVFSPTCSICTQTIPTWKELFAQAESSSVEVVGISVQSAARTAPYAQQNELPWKVYCVASRDSIAALGVERVPMTLVVEGEGNVAMVLQGELSEEQKQEVSNYLETAGGN